MDHINEDELLEQIRATLKEQAAVEEIELDEEQLDELSKKTLGSYIKKSARDLASREHDGGWAAADGGTPSRKEFKKMSNRRKGIDKATDKLVKESIEEMIGAAHEGKPVEFAAAFSSALNAVVTDKIEAMKPEVAASMFAPKE